MKGGEASQLQAPVYCIRSRLKKKMHFNLVPEFHALDEEEISEEAFSQEGDGDHTCKENMV